MKVKVSAYLKYPDYKNDIILTQVPDFVILSQYTLFANEPCAVYCKTLYFGSCKLGVESTSHFNGSRSPK